MIATKKGKKLSSNGHLARRNHYVPVWYQRKFLPTGQNSLCYLDLKPEEIILPDGQKILSNPLQIWGPKKCFRETDLYTTTVFGKLNDEIERFLFGEIDRKGPTAIEALLKQDWKTLSELFTFVFEYMDAQKLRTPKGLDWIASHYPQISHSDLMREMQTLRQMHCTMWVEGVMEIVTAEKSEVKFIVSDHPVTVYNPVFPPDAEMCRYPNDPPTALKGSQTIFPLDSDHCFILTNLEYAKERTEEKCAEYRTNVRYFAQTLTRFDTVIRNRHLNEEEIAAINFIIKMRSRRYLAAANEEWLYPEIIVKQSWNELGNVLLPPKDELWHFGGETSVGGKDGKLLWYQDEYGRNYNEKDKKYRIEDDLSIRERNLTLWNAISKIFGFSEGKDWNDIRQHVNDDKIRELYKVYSWLWPQDTDLMSLLPVPGESLRALYNGIIDPRVILPNVMGYALYTDQIILISPFVNPWNIATKYNPIDSPSQYRDQTLKNIGLMIQMLPLIDAGIVEMIPNPCDFDSHLRKNVWEMAQERLRGWKPGKDDLEEVEPLYKNDYLNLLLSLPRDHLKHHLRSALPEISEPELNNVVEYA